MDDNWGYLHFRKPPSYDNDNHHHRSRLHHPSCVMFTSADSHPGFLVVRRSNVLENPWNHLVGGFNPSKKYESQLGLLFPICGNSTCSKPPTSTVMVMVVENSRHISRKNIGHVTMLLLGLHWAMIIPKMEDCIYIIYIYIFPLQSWINQLFLFL